MADQLNVLVICGSLRKGSYNAALARTLPSLAPPETGLHVGAVLRKISDLQCRRARRERNPRRRHRLV